MSIEPKRLFPVLGVEIEEEPIRRLRILYENISRQMFEQMELLREFPETESSRDFEELISLSEDGFKRAFQIQNFVLASKFKHRIADIFIFQKKFEESITYCEEALDLAIKAGNGDAAIYEVNSNANFLAVILSAKLGRYDDAFSIVEKVRSVLGPLRKSRLWEEKEIIEELMKDRKVLELESRSPEAGAEVFERLYRIRAILERV